MTSPKADPGMEEAYLSSPRQYSQEYSRYTGLTGDPGRDVCGGLAHIWMIIPGLAQAPEGGGRREKSRDQVAHPQTETEPVIPGEVDSER